MKTPNINQILRIDRRSCARGAPMGDSDWLCSAGPLLCQRIRFIDGDYAADGTYWGGGHQSLPLWCAFDPLDPELGTRLYIRALNRREAVAELSAKYPLLTFKKP